MLCLSGFELYSLWVPLKQLRRDYYPQNIMLLNIQSFQQEHFSHIYVTWWARVLVGEQNSHWKTREGHSARPEKTAISDSLKAIFYCLENVLSSFFKVVIELSSLLSLLETVLMYGHDNWLPNPSHFCGISVIDALNQKNSIGFTKSTS